jgi:hypothetical protein
MMSMAPTMASASNLGKLASERPIRFSVYNPSVIAIPPATLKSFVAAKREQCRQTTLPRPTYHASFCVTTIGKCLPQDQEERNFLGLAILDSSFNVLADIVVHANDYETLWKKYIRRGVNAMQDFRLFVWNETLFVNHSFFCCLLKS